MAKDLVELLESQQSRDQYKCDHYDQKISYSEILKNLDLIREKHPKSKTFHKGESKVRICADMKDRHTNH